MTKRELQKERVLRNDAMELNARYFIAMQVMIQRQSRGMTRKQLAENSGLSTSQIAKIESGNWNDATLEALTKLASVFDLALQVKFEQWSAIQWGAP